MAHLVRRKLKKGDQFYVRYSLDGKVRWLAAGGNKRAAERIRDRVAVRVMEGRAGLIADRSDWTVERLMGVYLPRMEALKPRSADWRRHRVAHLVRLLGKTPLEDVNVGTIDRYGDLRLAEGASAGTVNGEVAVLRHAMGKAVLWKDETGLQENRVTGWRPHKGMPKREPRFLEPDEVARLVKASEKRGGPAHYFMMLFLATGARPGELLMLKPEDVSDRTLRLPALKGGTPRIVVVDSQLLASVREALPEWTKQKVRKHWEHAREDAKLGAVRLYDVRHTVASEMLRRGATMRDVQRLFGHQSARMTERYAHFSKNATALPSLTWAQ